MPSIKQNLLEMKNISELMTNLAYSAVFLKDRRISNEVTRLHQKIQQLEKDTLKLLFRIKESEDELMFIIDLTNSMRVLANTAERIAKLSYSSSFPSIVNDILKESDTRIIVETIGKGTKIIKRTFTDDEIKSKTKASIIAINRKNNWIFNIEDKIQLKGKDLIVAVGVEGSEQLLRQFLS